jgi:hypothetical protein
LKICTQLGLTAWGIYELFGVSCVDELKDKLLYIILQIYVIVDIVSIGCCFTVLFGMCGFYCVKGLCSRFESFTIRRSEARHEARYAQQQHQDQHINTAIPAVEVPANQATAVMEV